MSFWLELIDKTGEKVFCLQMQINAVFFFVNDNTMKPRAKKQRFPNLIISEERQQLVEEKDADNMRKVLCKSLIQWFWELNLCSYKNRVNCFDSHRLSVFFCCCFSMLKWNSRNITKHLMSGPSGNQLVLFSLESWCFLRLCLGKHQDSRSGKQKTVPLGIWH